MTPGILIYHSKDLVNWQIIGHADIYNMPNGTRCYNGRAWTPCIRHYNGKFHILYFDLLGFFIICISDKSEDPYE